MAKKVSESPMTMKQAKSSNTINKDFKMHGMPPFKRKRFGFMNMLRYIEYFTLININILIISFTLRMWI